MRLEALRTPHEIARSGWPSVIALRAIWTWKSTLVFALGDAEETPRDGSSGWPSAVALRAMWAWKTRKSLEPWRAQLEMDQRADG